MTTKNKLFLGLSIATFLATLFSILSSDVPNGILNNSLSISWIILLILGFLLPVFNLAEIIINRNDWNKMYWLGLIFNVLTIAFMMRYFQIDILNGLFE